MAQVNALISKANERTKHLDEARRKAQNVFNALTRAASTKDLQEVEPDLSMQLSGNEFDAACADRTRLSEGLSERIATTGESLGHMKEDFESCVGALFPELEEKLVTPWGTGSALQRYADSRLSNPQGFEN